MSTIPQSNRRTREHTDVQLGDHQFRAQRRQRLKLFLNRIHRRVIQEPVALDANAVHAHTLRLQALEQADDAFAFGIASKSYSL